MAEWFSPAQPSSDPTLCDSMSPLKRLLHEARCALKIKKQADGAAIGLKISATGFTIGVCHVPPRVLFVSSVTAHSSWRREYKL